MEVADRCLQFLRFGRGLAESTTRKYAEAIALYYRFCEERSADWASPDMTAFQMWLRVAPSPLHPHPDRTAWAGPGHRAARSNGRLNLITYAVSEMFKYAAIEGYWEPSKLGLLFETAPAKHWGARRDRRPGAASTMTTRRRHQLRTNRNERRDAPIDAVKAAVGACGNLRDAFLIITLATTGLRRGEALGLRLSDIHFLPSSTVLGCQFEGAHLHVRPRENSNAARVKRDKPRVVPVASTLVPFYDQYRHERDSCRAASASDYVFVNLYRQPLGEPMKLHAINELFSRLSSHVGQKITPHMLRHTFGTNAAREATLDVVAELLGHATIRSTEIYLHPDISLQRRAIEGGSLSSLLDPKAT
ncbi:tyrosine-type recombinase/integrase [Mycobacteroides franklinii]|uniref:tyrosine-type recombinase/integrase n=1 Tax=Mycobacteroides TaxID=670516 RepID=UPI0012FFAEC8|nr:tyrosine-type recombinase/integrase [Mycobacteroides franklinii]